MSQLKPWDNFRAILTRTHHPIIGFLVCYILAFFIQLTGFGIAIVIPGIIVGILLKNNLKAIITAFLAGFLVWLTLFGIMAAFNTQAFITAWFVLSPQIPVPQLFTSLIGGVVAGVGGQLGAMFAEIVFRPSDDFGLPPAPTERVPTEELPRRKRVKRKQVKKKKKRRKY